MSTPSIRQVSYLEILCAVNAQQLIDEYAAECSVPEVGKIRLQAGTYAQLEAAGVLTCFGVYEEYGFDDKGDGVIHGTRLPHGFFQRLIGFASVLINVLPHYGRKVATVESLFMAKARRSHGTWHALKNTLEDHSRESGCVALIYTARADGQLAKLLTASPDHPKTHEVFCRSLA